jgi:hypothetical protein
MTTQRVAVRIDRLALRNFRAELADERIVVGLIAEEVERQLPRYAWSRAVAAATGKAVTERIFNRSGAARA